jgi:ankyrin repeat protein
MKKLLLLSGAALIGANTYAQDHTPYEVKFVEAIGAKNLMTFGTSATDGEGFFHQFNGWNYYNPNQPLDIKDFDANSNSAFLLTNKDEIKSYYRPKKVLFTYAGIRGIKAISNTADGSAGLVAVGNVKQIDGTETLGLYKSSGQNHWDLINSDRVCSSIIRIDASSGTSGSYYAATSDGKAYRLSGDKWELISPTNISISDIVIGQNNKVYVVDKTGNLFERMNDTTWTPKNFSGSHISVDQEGNIYGVKNGKLHAVEGGTNRELTIENVNKLDASGQTELTKFALLDDKNGVKQAIENGTSPNFPNHRGEYPITIAAKNGNNAIVYELINAGANLELRDNSDKSALEYAVESGNDQVTQTLLIGKANPSNEHVIEYAVRNKKPSTLSLLKNYGADLSYGLGIAAELNDSEIFKSLVEKGAKPLNNIPFERAVDNNNKEIAAFCLENGIDKNLALNYTITKQNEDIAMLCAKNGANVDRALQFLLKQNSYDNIEYLAKYHKADANKILEAGVTKKDNRLIEIGVANGGDASRYLPSAVETNNLAMVETFLKGGANADTVLFVGTKNNNMEMVNLAINYKADASKNSSYLLHSVDHNNTEMAGALIRANANAKDTAVLHHAIKGQKVEMLNFLFAYGASAQDAESMNLAIDTKNESIVGTLLQYGADPNSGMNKAISTQQAGMVQLMLDKGASASDPQLIKNAARTGNKEICEKLLNRGASAEEGIKEAVQSGNPELVDLFYIKGASLLNNEYMFIAVSGNNNKMVEYLLAKNCPTDFENNSGENLLFYSCARQNYEVTEKLINAGVDVNKKSNSGDTPLHISANAGRNNVNVCTLLVDAGADVNAVNNRGKSVLKVADGRKLKDYLKSKGAKK